MHPSFSSQSRPVHLTEIASQGNYGLSSAPNQAALTHEIHCKDPCGAGLPVGHRDWHCPVCLQTASFPVQTNCGHLFCAPCLISYWRHGSWLDAISCPLCRQKVSMLLQLFSESQTDRQERKVLGEIKEYNKRYSGAPRRVTDYLCDAPLFLQLLLRGLGTMGVLVTLFFLRVALCCVGTFMSLSSPPLETVSSPTLEATPSLCGLLGLLDDLVVVFLLIICLINTNQQMAPERHNSAHTVTL